MQKLQLRLRRYRSILPDNEYNVGRSCSVLAHCRTFVKHPFPGSAKRALPYTISQEIRPMLELFGSSSLDALEEMSLSPAVSSFGSASAGFALVGDDDIEDEDLDEEDLDDEDDVDFDDDADDDDEDEDDDDLDDDEDDLDDEEDDVDDLEDLDEDPDIDDDLDASDDDYDYE